VLEQTGFAPLTEVINKQLKTTSEEPDEV
jgi:hypothetical protein